MVFVAASPGAAAEEALMSGGSVSTSDAEVEADIVGGIEEQVYEQDALALMEYELQEPDLDFQEPGGNPQEPEGAGQICISRETLHHTGILRLCQ